MKPTLRDVWPVTDPSEFVHQVTFLEQSLVNDASGVDAVYAAGSPPEVAWCKIEWMRGEDVIRAGQDTSQLYGTVTMHFRAGLVANRHIQTSDGSEYIISSVEDVQKRRMFHRINIVSIGANT